MKKKSTSQSAPARRSLGEGGFFNLRVLIASVFCLAGVSTMSLTASAQQNSWSVNNESRNNIATDKAVARHHFLKSSNYLI
jgi:hypothetical protein